MIVKLLIITLFSFSYSFAEDNVFTDIDEKVEAPKEKPADSKKEKAKKKKSKRKQVKKRKKKSSRSGKAKPTKTAQSKKEEGVLAFDAAVIEGERKSPTIFLDINVDKYSDIDSVLLIRKDFNDYHRVDRKLRTRYFNIND